MLLNNSISLLPMTGVLFAFGEASAWHEFRTLSYGGCARNQNSETNLSAALRSMLGLTLSLSPSLLLSLALSLSLYIYISIYPDQNKYIYIYIYIYMYIYIYRYLYL